VDFERLFTCVRGLGSKGGLGIRRKAAITLNYVVGHVLLIPFAGHKSIAFLV